MFVPQPQRSNRPPRQPKYFLAYFVVALFVAVFFTAAMYTITLT